MDKTWRTVFGTAVFNLALFVFVTSLPAFRDLHHHWIFPVLGTLFSVQWALAGGLFRAAALDEKTDAAALRATLLSLLAFLVLTGAARHQTILACFGRCSFKLGGAAALAAAVFARQARLRDPSFWGEQRALAAALGCGLWAAFLILYGLRLPRWVPDAAVLAGSAALLPQRGRPGVKAVLACVAPALLLGRFLGEYPVIFLGVPLACAGLWAAGRGAAPEAPGPGA